MATPSFEIQGIPDQKKADELTKAMLAHDFPIVDEDTYVAHGAIVQQHDALIRKLTVGEPGWIGFDPFVNGLFKMHKAAVALRAQFIDPLLASKQKWLNRGRAYKAKLEQEAADKRRIEEEKLHKQEVKALEKDAAKLERRGDTESAAILREQAQSLPVPTLPFERATPKIAGIVERAGWQFAVEDYDKVPDEFKTLDHTKKGERDLIDSKLRAVVSKLGDKIKIAGIRVWPATSVSSRKVG